MTRVDRPTLRLATVLALALIGCAPRFERPATPVVPETEGYVTTGDGTRLFYRKVGDGPGIVVVPADVFLHPGLRELAEGRTVFFYDMRNRGRSDSVSADREISIERDVADLEDLRVGLHLESMDLVGWSYLGLMTALYALDHPERVRRLVQIGPVPMRYGTTYPPGLGPEDFMAALDSSKVAELRRLRGTGYDVAHPYDFCKEEWAVQRFGLVGSPTSVERLKASPCEARNEWPTHFGRHLERHIPSIEKLQIADARVRALRVPTLVIHGTRDRNAPYGAGREWAMTLPDARLLTVKGGAHCPWADAPTLVVPAILTFLGGDWPPAAEKVETLERVAPSGS